jgi:hypothetical protein
LQINQIIAGFKVFSFYFRRTIIYPFNMTSARS